MPGSPPGAWRVLRQGVWGIQRANFPHKKSAKKRQKRMTTTAKNLTTEAKTRTPAKLISPRIAQSRTMCEAQIPSVSRPPAPCTAPISKNNVHATQDSRATPAGARRAQTIGAEKSVPTHGALSKRSRVESPTAWRQREDLAADACLRFRAATRSRIICWPRCLLQCRQAAARFPTRSFPPSIRAFLCSMVTRRSPDRVKGRLQ